MYNQETFNRAISQAKKAVEVFAGEGFTFNPEDFRTTQLGVIIDNLILQGAPGQDILLFCILMLNEMNQSIVADPYDLNDLQPKAVKDGE